MTYPSQKVYLKDPKGLVKLFVNKNKSFPSKLQKGYF